MTITMAVCRPAFAVLGSDQALIETDGDDRRVVGHHTKIVLHPTLPLGLAAGGLAYLPLNSRTTTVAHLQSVANGVQTGEDLSMESMVGRIKSYLAPLMPWVNSPRVPASVRPDLTVTITIALVRAGGAEVGTLRLGTQHGFEMAERAAMAGTESLVDFYLDRYQNDVAALGGDEYVEPLEVVAHVRSVIAAGIEEDARLNGGQNVHCGGGIDIALIDNGGARFVDNSALPPNRP